MAGPKYNVLILGAWCRRASCTAMIEASPPPRCTCKTGKRECVMPLFAFDGTFNLDQPGTEQRYQRHLGFGDVTPDPSIHFKGIGTRFGAVGRLAVVIFGAGGRERVDGAVRRMKPTCATAPARLVDHRRLSRGAALALAFAAEQGLRQGTDVRFLGLWDCGARRPASPRSPSTSAGISIFLTTRAQQCFHADVARRAAHRLRCIGPTPRLRTPNQEGRLFEVCSARRAFRRRRRQAIAPGLSSIALNWMFTKAAARGLLDRFDRCQRRQRGPGVTRARRGLWS